MDATPASIEIRPLAGRKEAEHCARMMCSSEPWITLQRSYDEALEKLLDAERETYVACAGDALCGFLILCMKGAFTGYIQTLCVAEEFRGQRIGTKLIQFVEERIQRESPNVFICVSSFNLRAKALYERLGYEVVGELKDFIVAGHSEFLLRKSSGPLCAFTKPEPPAPPREWRRGEYRITTDRSALDLDMVHGFLTTCYWAAGIPMDIMQRSLENSLCFGVFAGEQQAGFARVVTDYATFAYLADVFILEEHRGRGLGKWLMEVIMAHPALQGMRRWHLVTRDAHELYRPHGFAHLKKPELHMEKWDPEIYARA